MKEAVKKKCNISLGLPSNTDYTIGIFIYLKSKWKE